MTTEQVYLSDIQQAKHWGTEVCSSEKFIIHKAAKKGNQKTNLLILKMRCLGYLWLKVQGGKRGKGRWLEAGQKWDSCFPAWVLLHGIYAQNIVLLGFDQFCCLTNSGIFNKLFPSLLFCKASSSSRISLSHKFLLFLWAVFLGWVFFFFNSMEHSFNI